MSPRVRFRAARLMRTIVKLVKLLLPTIVGLAGGYFIFRPAAYADFNFSPQGGEAPLTVRFTNESRYYSSVMWNMGDGAAPRRDTGSFEYVFARPGEYRVKLTALGKDRHDHEAVIHVREASALRVARTVRITAVSTQGMARQNRSFPVSFVKDNHPVFLASDGADFSQRFVADDGYRIVDASFREESSGHASGIATTIEPNGAAATVRCRLESGPQVDRWRGWLHGTLTTTQEVLTPATATEITPELRIDRTGEYVLSASPDLSTVASIAIEELPSRTLVAAGAPSQLLVSTDGELRFSFRTDGGRLVIAVAAGK